MMINFVNLAGTQIKESGSYGKGEWANPTFRYLLPFLFNLYSLCSTTVFLIKKLYFENFLLPKRFQISSITYSLRDCRFFLLRGRATKDFPAPPPRALSDPLLFVLNVQNISGKKNIFIFLNSNDYKNTFKCKEMV